MPYGKNNLASMSLHGRPQFGRDHLRLLDSYQSGTTTLHARYPVSLQPLWPTKSFLRILTHPAISPLVQSKVFFDGHFSVTWTLRLHKSIAGPPRVQCLALGETYCNSVVRTASEKSHRKCKFPAIDYLPQGSEPQPSDHLFANKPMHIRSKF